MQQTVKIKSFRDLEVWKLGKKIVIETYRIANEFPQSELYGLASQTKRAAISIPSNISEGFNRFHNKEYRQFLYVALGSCAELETHLEIAFELQYVDVVSKENLLSMLNHEQGMLRNLIKKLL